MSRSEFFARAARHYLKALDVEALTARIDDAVERLDLPDSGSADAVAAGRSRLATVLAVLVTSNTSLADLPGNVFLPATVTGLPRDSVVDVTALVTLNKIDLSDWAGHVPSSLMYDVDEGLRQVLAL